MSRGTDYLVKVTEKIEKRMIELGKTVQEVQKDIENMNSYYWENYNEMDEYGYENFDNQQALLSQINAKQEHDKELVRLKKMQESPFFGSVDFCYEDEEEAEAFYIGIGNFAEQSGCVPLIYDWRAPVSSLFYDYDKGEASYEAPDGTMNGEITEKWQYKIRSGRMVYEFESDVKIDDDILKQELGGNSDVQLKNIVRTIQKEQNAIIRNAKDRILVIQGAAGSGKTSVALHRIAYLLYHDRKNLKASNVLVLSPNSVFSDYISHILPELGEENIREMSFDLFAYHELKGITADCDDRYHYIEHCMDGRSAAEEERYRWKQSDAFTGAVEGFLVQLEDRLIDFKDIEYKNMKKSAEELLTLYFYKFTEIPMLNRMEAVMEYCVDEYETLCGKSLRDDEMEIVREKFLSMYESRDIYEIYNWFLEEQGLAALPDVPLAERYLQYEDVYPVLYLKYRLYQSRQHKDIRHLVIDEMQDYSYLQYVILKELFPCKMTILGDRAQSIDSEEQDVLQFLPNLFGKKGLRIIELNDSYRNTLEIATYAQQISGVKGIHYLERHGKAVEEIRTDKRQALEQVLEKVYLGTDGYKDGYETTAVLTMTEKEAREAYAFLKERREDVHYIDRDTSAFKKGITVTTYYLAKGLEFDQVFVLCGDKDHEFYKQYLYICATRALHELGVFVVN